MDVLMAVLIFAAGVIVGFTIAAVTETRVEAEARQEVLAGCRARSRRLLKR